MAVPIAVLKLSKRVKNVITFAQNVATAMTNNPAFPTPNPPLVTFQTDVAALNTAETAALSRAKGAVETRNAQLVVVRSDLENLRTYVQTVAHAANPSNAEAIIQGAGMAVRKSTLHDKAALAVKPGTVSGTVNLAAKAAAKHAAYTWQYSTDQKTWTSLPQTMKAKAGVAGLASGTVYYFRVQALTTTGEANWSQIVSMMVQ
jgi:hypothetical protein